MTNVQHIIENVQVGNGCMTEVATYGEGVNTDLQGTANLADVAASIGGALARVESLMGPTDPDNLTGTYEDTVRANAEAKDAELAYLTAGANESSDPDARLTVSLSHRVEEITAEMAAQTNALSSDLRVVLTGLVAVKEALTGYEERRASVMAAVQRGMIEAPRAAITAGEAYIARLGGAPDVT